MSTARQTPTVPNKPTVDPAEPESPTQGEWNDSVAEESLKKSWIRYARSIEEQNPRLYSIMYNQLPFLKHGSEVWVKIKNSSQEIEFQNSKSLIVTFLRSELRNAQLNLNLEMTTEEVHTDKAFTAADKFKAMMEKNSALNALRQQFGLDLD